LDALRTDLSDEELIALVRRIMTSEGTEKEIDAAIQLFDANCANPRKNGLIFWPHGFPHDPAKPEPTAEQIVALARTPGSVIRL
jgi:Colicin immunity protein / pyocin immunity protein